MVTIDAGNYNRIFRSLNFVVDTGFTGELAMPPEVIRQLVLDYERQTAVTLANDRQIPANTYRGIVIWHGRHRGVRVIEMDGDPLLGMSLLWGSKLTINARPGGAVLIDEDDQ